jgi:Holliday junction DNA helicase RuvA
MFSYIKGTVAFKHNNVIVVEAAGIGYKIGTSSVTLEKCGEIGANVQIFTYLYVRENIFDLIGFMSREELTMFELLITVSGVGPKAALAICGLMSPSKFSLAVISDDHASIAMASGIGPKTGKRIILELKDKMKKTLSAAEGSAESIEDEALTAGKCFEEAISALIVLGYSPKESWKAVKSVYKDEMELESIVKNALMSLMK